MSSERAARRGLPHNAFETDGAELSRVDRANCGLLSRDSPLLASRPVTFSKWSVRESILNPQAKIVAGFGPIMPTFTGQINEESLIQLVAYVKSLQGEKQQTTGAVATSTTNPNPEVKRRWPS